MRIAFLGIWSGPALAALVALLLALVLRAMKQVPLSGLAAPAGIAAGWIVTLGLILASPRQLPERLPLLSLAALVFGLAAQAVAKRQVFLWVVVGLGCLGTGWWMAGAPMTAADIQRGAVTIGAAAATAGLGYALMQASWQPLAAALAFAAALLVAGIAGPAWLLAAIAVTAALAAWVGGAAPEPAMRLPMAMILAALIALPPLSRGALLDWLVAASAPVALLVGPLVARRLPPEAVQVIGAIVAALPVLAAIAWYAGRFG